MSILFYRYLANRIIGSVYFSIPLRTLLYFNSSAHQKSRITHNRSDYCKYDDLYFCIFFMLYCHGWQDDSFYFPRQRSPHILKILYAAKSEKCLFKCVYTKYKTSPSGIGGWFFLFTGSENAAKQPETLCTHLVTITAAAAQHTSRFGQSGAKNTCEVHATRALHCVERVGQDQGPRGGRRREIRAPTAL